MKKYIFLILSLITLVVLMLQLTFPVSAAESTCAEQGYTTYTCACGDSYIDNYTDEVGHSYENGSCLVCKSVEPMPSVGSIDELTALIREEMINRQDEIEIRVNGLALTGSDVLNSIISAREHTGDPRGGDYITAHMVGGYNYNAEVRSDSDGIYTIVTVSINFISDSEMEAEVDAAVDALLEELDLWGATDYRKIKGVYDWMTENIVYDYEWDDVENDDAHYRHTAHAALIEKQAVCQGIASLFYRLMLELDVDCRYISGMSNSPGSSERHAWNIVALDGKYYNMDATWDLGLTGYYRYFLRTEANFAWHDRDYQYATASFNAQYPMATLPYVENATASGTVNSRISWVLDGDTGTLTVAGTGAIPSYRFSKAPWYDYRNSVKRIVVEEGITEVGERAFYWSINCTELCLPESLIAIREYGFNNLQNLKQVTLPSNLRIIEFCAFSECTALESITLPDSVTTVGSSAFSNCYALRSATLSAGMNYIPDSMFFGDYRLSSITIPEGVVRIDDTVFSDCGFTQFTIPSTVTKIGVSAFSSCDSLSKFIVEEGNTAYKAVDGVLFSADGTHLISYPAGKTGSSYSVPEGTKYIDYGAFREQRYLYYVYFPASLIKIDGYAFSYCKRLQKVTLPSTLTTLGSDIFRDCTSLYSVTFGNQSIVLGDYMFSGCTSLSSITLPTKLAAIPNGLFDDCTSLRSINIPSTVTKIGSTAFCNCDSLTSVTIPGSVKSIGQQAFDFCQNLTTIIFEDGVKTLDWIAVRNAPRLTKVVIPASLTSIGKQNFESCPLVTLYVTCYSTGYNYAKNNGIKYSTSHNYSYSTVTYPTCTQQGYTTYTCPCGSSYKSNYVSKLGHTEAIYEAVAPDCINNGLTEGKYCSVCGVDIVKQTVVSALGHSLTQYEGKSPTCLEPGYMPYEACSVCDYTTYEPIPAVEHTYEYVITSPTCVEQGYTTHTCLWCGDSYVDDYVEAVGHSFNQGFVCSDCGYTAKVSVLGDSISTFSGVSGVKNAVYPNSTVKSTSDTWWYQVVDAMGGEVLKVNASGGSRILSDEYFAGAGIRDGNYAAYRDRCVDLHIGNDNPDIIFVFMGTNDFSYHVDSNCEKCKLLLSCSECTSREDGNLNVCSACRAASGVYSSFCNMPLGTADSVDISRESPTSSCEAYAIMLSKMKDAYPDAQIYCLGLLPRVNPYQNAVYHDHGQPTEFNAELKKVAQNMGASFIDLEKCVDNSASSWNTYFGDAVHPTATGMDHISIAVISEILGSKVYMISSEVADGFALSGELYAIAGNTYRATISSANTDLYPNVRIAMSGNDITEAAFDPQTGEIVIDNVTGDIVISIKANIVASDEIVWSVGAVNGSNGSLVDMSNRIRTNMFDISRGAVIIASNGAEFCPIFYDKDGKFVYSPNAFDSDGLLEIPAGQYVYMRLWARNKNDINADLIPAYGENINIALGLESLSWEIGTIYCGDNATGLNANNYNNRIRTGFISISGVVYVRATSNALINVVFYDENYKILPLGNNCGFTTEWSSDNAPATTVYIRVVAKDISDMALTVAYGENIILEYGCDHNYESKVTAPTCTEQGYTTYTCLGCGDSYVNDYTVLNGHDWKNEIIIVNPTCTTDGVITYICTCGEEKTEVKSATGHIYESEITAPTCTDEGFTTYICSECGDYYVADFVDAIGHIAGVAVVENNIAPDCISQGSYENVFYCIVCSEEIDRTIALVDALGHAFTSYISNGDATCINDGTETSKCERCDETDTRIDVGSALGHNYNGVVTAPDCVNEGYTIYTCSVCADNYVADLVDALGHTEAVDAAVAPTCTESGLTEGKHCSVCYVVIVAQEVISANGHNYDSVVTLPTCEEQGYTTHTCHCGDVIVETYVSALGHSFGKWQVEKAPTCEGKGSERRDCERCDYSESRSIAPKGHNWVEEDEYDVCRSCGEIIEKEPAELEKDHSECEGGVFEIIINAIINFFRMIFGLPEICICGEEY